MLLDNTNGFKGTRTRFRAWLKKTPNSHGNFIIVSLHLPRTMAVKICKRAASTFGHRAGLQMC